MLAQVPASLQQAIARRNRISLPRSCSPDERLLRLRRALCRQAGVRVTYQALTPDEQAALQALRHIPRGLRPAELQARFGPIRAPAALRADPTPQSLSERLLLLGWLLPCPAAPHNPPRYLLPPELRRWLPQPPRFAPHGAPPPATPPPALAVSTALLLACATDPLPLRADHSLGRPALRRLAPLLADVDATQQADFCTVIWPLLQQRGLVISAHGQATLSPAATSFLKRPASERLKLLREAWIGGPDCDAWLHPLLIDQRGIDWPCLRQRLCAWAASLPTLQAVAPCLYPTCSMRYAPCPKTQALPA
jgi:hypothetical protein